MSRLSIRMLGPLEVEANGVPVPVTKRRHREIIGILLAAKGRPVPTRVLVDELWEEPPAGAVGALRTFVGELRRLLEPDRTARTPPTVLVTVNDGYALVLPVDAVDAWRMEHAIEQAAGAAAAAADDLLTGAVLEWRGPPLDEFSDREWSGPERRRLVELRARAVEALAEVRLPAGEPGGLADLVPLLDAQVAAHPWREESWRLLALALYRGRRQADALAVLRRARAQLADGLGLDPGVALAELESRMLAHDPGLEGRHGALDEAVSAYARTTTRAQLEAANAVLASLAVAGGPTIAREERLRIIAEAEAVGDPELTARIVGGFEVPGVWTRSDDPAQSEQIVAAAERALAGLPRASGDRARVRLLATIALESRGTAGRRGEALEAERLARRIGDPNLICVALSARSMQEFERTGLAGRREAIGAELVEVALEAESSTFEITGRLIRMQALCALDELDAAEAEADAVDALARRHERPLASVFTAWFRHGIMGAASPPPLSPEMPGFTIGISALATLVRQVRERAPLDDGEFGPYEPWVRPLLLHEHGDQDAAAAGLAECPDPPNDLMMEATWCLVAEAARRLGDRRTLRRAATALDPARAERAAGSGVVDLGPVAGLLDSLHA